MLEKGLNVACMFFGKWHRGIIKAVDHKCQVTVNKYEIFFFSHFIIIINFIL